MKIIDTIVTNYFKAIHTHVSKLSFSINVCVFNVKLLKLYCFIYGYVFFDVYDNYINEHGFLNKKLSDGNVHIQDGKHLTDFMEQFLL